MNASAAATGRTNRRFLAVLGSEPVAFVADLFRRKRNFLFQSVKGIFQRNLQVIAQILAVTSGRSPG